jgi:YD repeat-containing protein
MVATVSGNGLGLSLTSLTTLGQLGSSGNASHGRGNEAVYINTANGNLVLQHQDDFLASRGLDAQALRTYNSQGLFTDDNGDNWSNGAFAQQLRLTGTRGTAGSTLTRTNRDGAQSVYTYSTGTDSYVNSDGAGAFDTITYDSATGQYVWRDGSTGTQERYESATTGRLLSATDAAGNTLTYTYTGNLLTLVTDASGDRLYYDYSGNNLTQVRSVTSAGVTTTRTRYAYDTSNRLTTVTTDLSPEDNTIADGRTYVTTYTYDGTSRRVQTLTQTDGTALTFGYTQAADGSYRVTSVTQTLTTGVTSTTLYDYAVVSSNTTLVANANGAVLSTVGSSTSTLSGTLSTSDSSALTATLTNSNTSNLVGTLSTAGSSALSGTLSTAGSSALSGTLSTADSSALVGTLSTAGSSALTGTLSTAGSSALVGTLSTAGSSALVGTLSTAGSSALVGTLSTAGSSTRIGTLSTTKTNGRNGSVLTYDESGTPVYTVPWDESGTPVSWGAIVQTLYGVSASDAASAGTALSAYYGYAAPYSGMQLYNPPASLTYSVPPYYTVPSGATWTSITQTLYGTSVASAVSALQTQQGNPPLTAGRQLVNLPSTLNYTVPPYYSVPAGATWTSITQALYGTSHANAVSALQSQQGNPTLTTGLRLTNLPSTLNYTVAPYYSVPAGATWTSITQALYGTSHANAVSALQSQQGNPTLTAGLRLSNLPSTLNYTVAPYYSVPAGATWTSITQALYGTSTASAVGALQSQQGNPTLTAGLQLSNLPSTLNYTVAPYYSVPAGATWTSITQALYGTSTASAVSALQSQQGNPSLTAGLQLTNLPSTLNYTVPPYYTVPAGATWTSITQALYGTSVAGAVSALQSQQGNPTLTTGLRLTNLPSTLNYTVAPYYTVPAGATWTSITQALYGTSHANAVSALQSQQGNPTLTTGLRLTNLPATLNYTVAPYYSVPAGATWTSITQALYGTNSATAASVLQSQQGNPTLTTGLRLTNLPASLTYTVSAYYSVPSGATWTSITQTLYGTSAAGAVSALQTQQGNPTLTTGLQLVNLPTTLTYTVPAYYTVPAGSTWASITQALYGTSHANAVSALQSQQGNPTLTTGLRLVNLPASLTHAVTVAPYYTVASGNTWASITQTVYGTNAAAAVSALQSALGNPALVAGTRLTMPATLSYAGTTATGMTTTVTNPLGQATVFHSDIRGQITSIVGPAIAGGSQSVGFTYNANGDVMSSTDARNNTTNYSYDANGNQVLQRDAAGNTITRTFNARNQVLTETLYLVPDPDGAGAATASQPLVTRYVYDAGNKNLLRFVLSAEGRVTEHVYNAYGERTSTIQYAGGNYPVSGLAATAVPIEAEMATWAGSQDRTRTQRIDMVYDYRGQLQRTTSYASVNASGAGILDASASATQYVYDQAGQLLTTISPSTPANTTNYTYDGLGRVLTVTDSLTQISVNQYDDANNRTRVTLANGLVTTSSYDRAGRLVSVLQSTASIANLGETKYVYDAADRLRMTQDPTGVRTHLLYDAAGRKVAEIDGDGSMVEYVYNKNNQVTLTIAHASPVTAALVDGSGNPLNVTLAGVLPAANALDGRTWRAYDTANRLVKVVDASGAVTETTYDGASRVVKQTHYATRISTSALGTAPAPSDIAPSTSAADRVERTFYDADGKLLASLDAEGYLTESQYDSAGQPVVSLKYATKSPSAYLASGTLSQLRPGTNAADIRTVTLYNGKGQVMARVDGQNYLTEFVYDANGNQTRAVQYATKLTGTVAATALIASIRPTATAQDQVTVSLYDLANRLSETTAPDGTVTKYAYDSVGRLVTTTRAFGLAEVTAINTRFDVQGRVTGELSGVGSALLTGGLTQAQIDAIWTQYGTTYTYDTAGRRITATDPKGYRTLYFYAADGQLRYTVNALGEVQENTYNALNQRTSSVRYTGRIALTGLSGGMVNSTLTNAVNAVAAGYATRYTYDANGRVLTVVDPAGGTTLNEYDAEGRLVKSTTFYTPNSTTPTPGKDAIQATRYDHNGRVRFTVDGTGGVVEYIYDANGNVAERIGYANVINLATWNGSTDPVAVPDAARDQRVRTVYDSLNRPSFVADGMGQVTGYVYDAFGKVTKQTQYATTVSSSTSPSAVIANAALDRVTSFVYDTANRRTWQADATGAVTRTDFDAKGNAIRRTAYATLVAAGAAPNTVVANASLDRVTTMSYDKDNRLVYTLDALGYATINTYDTRGQLSSTKRYVNKPSALGVTPTAHADDREDRFTYDAAGRLDTSTDALGGVERFTYDGIGNKRTFTNKKNSVWTYTYDAAGRLLTEQSPVVSLSSTSVVNGDLALPSRADAAILTRFSYDGLGNLRTRTEAEGRAEQRTTTYEYDAAGRQIRVSYPPVAVYIAETAAQLAANGQSGLALASEAQNRVLSTQTFYDGLGNAVANIDVANNLSLKGYDAMGRVTYEVDAMGYITRHGRNAFGEVDALTRYATARPTLVATNPTSAGQVSTSAQIAAAVVTSGLDRVLTTGYDKLGRVAEVSEPAVYSYDSTATTTSYETASKRTRSTYNAFGELVQVAALKNQAENAWLYTAYYYNAGGQRTTTVDALGYVTAQTYDEVGNLRSITEYANAITRPAADGWRTAAAIPTANADDRTTNYVYDRGNRKISETRLNVEYSDSTPGSMPTAGTRRSLTTEYGYDALGNLTRTTDPAGNHTYSYYDALGRVTAVAAPTRNSTADGAALTPLTFFHRDAHGNVVARIEAARSAVSASEHKGVSTTAAPGFTAGAADTLDRATLTQYDLAGHATRVRNANGYSAYTSYNERGQVAKTWQGVMSAAPTAFDASGKPILTIDSTIYQAYRYDKLGQLTETLDPAPATTLRQGATAQIISASARTPGSAGYVFYRGTNVIEVGWSTLIEPQGGAVRVRIDYLDGNGTATSRSLDFANASAVSGGASFTWSDNQVISQGGSITSITAVYVSQYNSATATWQPKWDGAPVGSDVNVVTQAAAGSTITAQEYNAFGELTRKGINGGRQEYYEYDNAGRLWRSNKDGGVDKVFLYDLLGNKTAEISSSGAGRADVDFGLTGSITSASAAVAQSTARRTDIRYDALGRVVAQIGPERLVSSDGVTVRSLTTGWSVASSNVFGGIEESGAVQWTGTANSVNLSWTTLANLGAGDVRVELDYTTANYETAPAQYDESGNLVAPAVVHAGVPRTVSRIYTPEVAASGIVFSWSDNLPYGAADAGISAIRGLRVFKKDAAGNWVNVINRTSPGAYGTVVEIATSKDGTSTTSFQYRQQGSSTWIAVGATNFGDALRFDGGALSGTYQYQVIQTTAGQPAQYSAIGTFTAGTNGTIAGPSAWSRPVVTQLVDRWGNVTERSDPRFASWKTTYRYNANNQIVEENKPNNLGVLNAADSPVTRIYYDKLGRQIGVRDANGNVTGQTYDAAGNLIEELRPERNASGAAVVAVTSYRYNAFGDRVLSTDAIGNAEMARALATGDSAQIATATTFKNDHSIIYAYDGLGQTVLVTRGSVSAWGVSETMTLTNGAKRNLVERSDYDQAGRKIAQVNLSDANRYATRYRYDLAGHVTQTTQPLGQSSKVVYDAMGRKTAEIDANGLATKWSFDYFGLLIGQTDLGGAVFTYTHDKARQLTAVTNTRGKNQTNVYDAAGQLVQINDLAINQKTTYSYDLAGQHTREKTVQRDRATNLDTVFQDNHLAYDTLGRLRSVDDGRVHIGIEYDLVGNRKRIQTHVNLLRIGSDSVDDIRDSDRYFFYDAMNRQTVVDGLNSNGDIGYVLDAQGNRIAQGHRITYDLNGNRKTDTFWGNSVSVSGGEVVIIGWDESGEPIYHNVPHSYTAVPGEVTETYGYDVLDRLTSVTREGGIQVDYRLYDVAGRVVKSGPDGSLPTGYATALNQGIPQGGTIGMETRINRYDGNGRMLKQKVLNSDNSFKHEVDYQSYDKAGNVLRYAVSGAGTYRSTLTRFDGYKEARSDMVGGGSTLQAYDANGYLTDLTDTVRGSNNRYFVNDSAGHAIYANQGGRVQRQMVVNGEVLGRYGQGINEVVPRNGNGDPNFTEVADFNFGYQPISGAYPAASVGAYTVLAGDTLRSIARSAYGDEELWYRVADANGLTSDRDLRVGQTLSLPSNSSAVHNNSGTYKPYDPSKITGDTTPSALPPPGGNKGCGIIGTIIMVVVAVIVTIYTAGAAAGAMGAMITTTASCTTAASMGAWAAGLAVMSGSAGALGIAAAAIGAAAGSIVSQGVGMAMGNQDKFSWQQVGLAAVGGAASAGVGTAVAEGVQAGAAASQQGLQVGYGAKAAQIISQQPILRAAIVGATTQGVAVATGLQQKFDWKGVAASGAGAGVAQLAGVALNIPTGEDAASQQIRTQMDGLTKLAKATIQGFVSGVTVAAMKGGKVNLTQVATDAFGNALGESLKAEITVAAAQSKLETSAQALDLGAAYDRRAYGPDNTAFDFGNPLLVAGDVTAGNNVAASGLKKPTDRTNGIAPRATLIDAALECSSANDCNALAIQNYKNSSMFFDVAAKMPASPLRSQYVAAAENYFEAGEIASAARFTTYTGQNTAASNANVVPNNTYASWSFGGASSSGLSWMPSTDNRTQGQIDQDLNYLTNVIAAAPLLPFLGAELGAARLTLGTSKFLWASAIGGGTAAVTDATGQYVTRDAGQDWSTWRWKWEQTAFAGVTGMWSGPIGATKGLFGNMVLGAVGSANNTMFNNRYYNECTDVTTAATLGGGFGFLAAPIGNFSAKAASTIGPFNSPLKYQFDTTKPALFQPFGQSTLAASSGYFTGGVVGASPSYIKLDSSCRK